MHLHAQPIAQHRLQQQSLLCALRGGGLRDAPMTVPFFKL